MLWSNKLIYDTIIFPSAISAIGCLCAKSPARETTHVISHSSPRNAICTWNSSVSEVPESPARRGSGLCTRGSLCSSGWFPLPGRPTELPSWATSCLPELDSPSGWRLTRRGRRAGSIRSGGKNASRVRRDTFPFVPRLRKLLHLDGRKTTRPVQLNPQNDSRGLGEFRGTAEGT